MKIKLMSFNIQHGRNHNLPGDTIDLPLMAKTILAAAPDFIGMQEVRRGAADPFTDQPAAISAITGGRPFFGRAISFGEGKDYGNAAISHLPIERSEIHFIPDPEKKGYDGYYETRCVMKLNAICAGKKLTLLVTHFGLNPDEQENAVDTILNIVSDCDDPVILMGDLNMTPGEAPLERLASQLTDAAAALNNQEFTFPSDKPDRRIDFFWYRGVTAVSISTVKTVASDHCALIAEFEV